jgi:CheY-like chemotaxis protein/anti-sigma regulatory factor (Ser/Thr protein kinase)
VVKSLIQFGQPELPNQAPLELHGVVREVRTLLENISRNRVRIVEALAPEPLWIHGDAGSINHVLMNLCINALDAMADGGTLTLRTAAGPDRAEVAVADDGAGMDPDVLAHAMEPFYTTKPVGKGTGLGLSMSYGVVTAHGGTIEIASQPGQGTTVTLGFPRIAAPPLQAPAAAPPALGSMVVLLVDDDEDVRFLMTRMLKKAGVRQVKTYAGGEALLAALGDGERPDLVILDQNMPGLDGVQTMERIRLMLPRLPVLISSGQPDIQEWDCFRRPGVGVISKPFTLEEIQTKVALVARSAPDQW